MEMTAAANPQLQRRWLPWAPKAITESQGGEIFFPSGAPGAQKPGQVRAVLRVSKTGRVVVAGGAGRELPGLGSRTWHFGLGGGQPRRGCGSGCSAEDVEGLGEAEQRRLPGLGGQTPAGPGAWASCSLG